MYTLYLKEAVSQPHTTRCHDNVPSIVGGFVVKNDPRGVQKQPRGNVPLAWPSSIHPFSWPLRGSNSQPRCPIRYSFQ